MIVEFFNNIIQFVFPIKITTFLDLSVIISIVGIALYFLGRLIIENRPLEDDKNKFVVYFNGLYYFLFFIVVPIFVCDILINNNIYIKTSFWFILLSIFIYFIIGILSREIIVRSLNIDKLVKRRIQKNTPLLLNQFAFSEEYKENIYKNLNKAYFYYFKFINSWRDIKILFLLSILNIFLIFNSLKFDFPLLGNLIIFIFSFFSMCVLVILYGFTTFKPVNVKITLKNNDILKGELLKRDSNGLKIDKNHKAIVINFQEIKFYEYYRLNKKLWDKNLKKKFKH